MTLSLPILLTFIGFLALGMVALGLAWGQSADVLNGVDDVLARADAPALEDEAAGEATA